MGDFIRVSEAKDRYLSGVMSLRWWYRQIEDGKLTHFRAGGAVLLRPADIDAFVAAMLCDKTATETVTAPADPPPPPPLKPRSTRRGLRFFGD